jgi:hypothetical protein
MNGDYEKVITEASHSIAQAILTQERGLKARAITVDLHVKEILRRIGLGVMTEIFAVLAQQVTEEKEAEGVMVNRRSRITYSVVFGPVEVESPYHWSSDTKHSARPVRDELGLRSRGRSPGVERALTDFGAEESFGQASKRFEEHYGWDVGRTSILRLVEHVARDAEDYVEGRLAKAQPRFEEPIATRPGCDQMLVELDGSEIRTGKLRTLAGRARTPVRRQRRRRRQEEWRDVRVGFARGLHSVEKTYVARMAPYPVVTEQLFRAAVTQGLSSRTQVIAPADGGNGLREALEERFPGMRFILDRPHLKGHLFETAEALGYDGVRRHAWVDERIEAIDAGRVPAVLKRLKRQHTRTGSERLRQLIGYLTKFQDAVHYDRYRKLGLPCGSGEVESAHRTIPQKRLKLPGACWRPETINPMLALRVLRANGWWSDFWQNRALRAVA